MSDDRATISAPGSAAELGNRLQIRSLCGRR